MLFLTPDNDFAGSDQACPFSVFYLLPHNTSYFHLNHCINDILDTNPSGIIV
jgi:hypothetical protein